MPPFPPDYLSDREIDLIEHHQIVDIGKGGARGELKRPHRRRAEVATTRTRARILDQFRALENYPFDTQVLTVVMEDTVSGADKQVYVPDGASMIAYRLPSGMVSGSS
jgi:hypothetical protein